ncbi:hypothetical protein ACIQOW_34240 [Kitasatospora sp. NPDC091335]|uniref:hypothetical protein n=1 Tax=Kitasatospora sp. NPDC091335 TaxID=3364085 RepID=UPI0037FD8E10
MSEQGQEEHRGQGQGQDRDEDQVREHGREPRETAAAKARLVFRDPLDQQSADDTDAGWGDRPGAGESGGRGLDWYLSQRPPHHGG